MGVLKRLGFQGNRRQDSRSQDQALIATTIGRSATEESNADHDSKSAARSRAPGTLLPNSGGVAAVKLGKRTAEEDNPDRAITPLERAMADAACATAEGTITLSVVRSGLWVPEGTEETWRFEVPRCSTLADIKAAIFEIHDLPMWMQRLQTTPTPGDPCLNDATMIDSTAILKRPLHLLPVAELLRQMQAAAMREEELDVHLREAAEAAELMQRRLAATAYRLHFVGAGGAGGYSCDQNVSLDIPALCPVEQVQAIVEDALQSETGIEAPAVCLAFNGQLLPRHAPIQFLGIGDGDTIQLIDAAALARAAEESADEESDDDSLDGAIRNWAFK